MSWERDRNDNDVPDWQEDENYADEAPIRGPGSPRARMGSGCALPVALLLAGAGLIARLATRPRGLRVLGPSGGAPGTGPAARPG